MWFGLVEISMCIEMKWMKWNEMNEMKWNESIEILRGTKNYA